jgi:hypothetical protein
MTTTIPDCTYMGNSTTACGCPTVMGKSYCIEHIYIVYKQGTARAKRKKELTTVDKVRMVEELMHEAIAELEAEGFDVYGERELDLDRL